MRLSFFLAITLLALGDCNCSKKACTPGQQDCPCKESAECDGESVCGAGNICVAPTFVDISVSNSEVRACEILLTEQPGTQLAYSKFKTGTVGTSIRQAPKVALTFTSESNQSLTSGSVQLAVSGQRSGLGITQFKCVDNKGVAVTDPKIALK